MYSERADLLRAAGAYRGKQIYSLGSDRWVVWCDTKDCAQTASFYRINELLKYESCRSDTRMGICRNYLDVSLSAVSGQLSLTVGYAECEAPLRPSGWE